MAIVPHEDQIHGGPVRVVLLGQEPLTHEACGLGDLDCRVVVSLDVQPARSCAAAKLEAEQNWQPSIATARVGRPSPTLAEMSLVSRLLDRFGNDVGRDPERDRAVIDLLELVMLIDRSVVEAERASVIAFLDGCDWDDGDGPASYSQLSTARARLALELPDELETLLASATAGLTTEADRAFALDAMSDLAGVDGVIDPREHALIEGLRSRFAELD